MPKFWPFIFIFVFCGNRKSVPLNDYFWSPEVDNHVLEYNPYDTIIRSGKITNLQYGVAVETYSDLSKLLNLAIGLQNMFIGWTLQMCFEVYFWILTFMASFLKVDSHTTYTYIFVHSLKVVWRASQSWLIHVRVGVVNQYLSSIYALMCLLAVCITDCY